MDYNEVKKHCYEKIICMAKLRIINLDNELYELYNKWLGAYDIKNKMRINILSQQINVRELQLYQINNNVKLQKL